MANINLSAAVRSNLSSLQNTATLMAKTSDRLSSGNKVNSALDNPTNFFTASSLNSRAGDLNQLMDSMANGVKTIEAADNGLTAITKNLESMQSTLRQARQDKSFETGSFNIPSTGLTSSSKLTFTGGAFDGSEQIGVTNTVISGNNGFRGLNGTSGSAGTLTLTSTTLNNNNAVTVAFTASDTAETTAKKINDQLNAAVGGNGGVSASVVDGQLKVTNSEGTAVTLGGTARDYIGLEAKSSTAVVATVVGSAPSATVRPSITFQVNGVSVTAPAIASGDAIAAGDAIQAAIDAATITGVTAGHDAVTGAVTLTDSNGKNISITGAAADLQSLGFTGSGSTATSVNSTNGVPLATVGSVASTTVSKTADQLISDINSNADLKGKIRASNDNGKLRIENLSTQELNIGGINSGGSVDGATTGAASILGNKVRADMANQFNELRDQLDKLADDASFNGINLLRGDNLKITFNETGTSSIDIQTKEGKSINSTNLNLETTLEAKDLDSDETIDGFVDQIKSALGQVRTQASAFGSNLSIVQNRTDFTKSMINTLETGAGNLTLADMNQEAANMMALQTRQSLASSTLSMANQADQGVLQLLR